MSERRTRSRAAPRPRPRRLPRPGRAPLGGPVRLRRPQGRSTTSGPGCMARLRAAAARTTRSSAATASGSSATPSASTSSSSGTSATPRTTTPADRPTVPAWLRTVTRFTGVEPGDRPGGSTLTAVVAASADPRRRRPSHRRRTARAASPAPGFLNRELSWLDFNARVLALADDDRVPLLERAKFLAIFSQNLDEFFQVRVAGLKDQVAAGLGDDHAPTAAPPAQQLLEIRDRARAAASRGCRRAFLDGRSPRPWPTPASCSRRGTSSTRTTGSTSSRCSRSASSRCSRRWPSTPATRSRTSPTCRSTWP